MVNKVGETQKGKQLNHTALFPSDLGGLAFKIA